MNINRFFTEVLGAQLRNPRWSWGATDTVNHRVYLRVWEDFIQSTANGERIWIDSEKEARRPSNGFAERHRHVSMIRGGAEGYGVVCTAADPDTTEARRIVSFDHDFLIRLGNITQEGGYTYAEIRERIPVAELARPQTSNSTLADDLRAITRLKTDTTTKEALVNARIGQGLFRLQVLKAWGNRCAVTGSVTFDAIRASHIKPWRDSSNEERLDPQNGLPLIASLDALFDAGLISFDDTGNLVVPGQLPKADLPIFSVVDRRLQKPLSSATKGYLQYHRLKVFQK